jgi:hypothetical protein
VLLLASCVSALADRQADLVAAWSKQVHSVIKRTACYPQGAPVRHATASAQLAHRPDHRRTDSGCKDGGKEQVIHRQSEAYRGNEEAAMMKSPEPINATRLDFPLRAAQVLA